MPRNAFIALWQDWIAEPTVDLFRQVLGALQFTAIHILLVPAFLHRHLIAPPRVHMFPERLFLITSRLVKSNLVVVLLGSAFAGRLLNGGLIFLPAQRLLFTYALRGQLVQFTVNHLLPASVALLLIARAGTGIAVRTTLSRQRHVWPSVEASDEAATARTADLLVLPRAIAVGFTGGFLAVAGLFAMMVGFSFEWDAVRFASSLISLFQGFHEFLRLTGEQILAVCLVKTTFIGVALGFVSCYEGLRGSAHDIDVYLVVGRTFSSSLMAWIITDVWVSLLFSAFRAVVYGDG